VLNKPIIPIVMGSYLSSAIALCDGLTLADLSILVSIVTALLSSIANLVYTWRKDRREQRASDAAAAQLDQ
jgi:hypothetical protein